MIHHELYSKICTISLFLVSDILSSFLFSDLLVIISNITFILLSESVSNLSFLSIWLEKKNSTVVHWRDRSEAQLDTRWPVICFTFNFWCRRCVVLPWLLTDDFLIPHSFWHNSERSQLTLWIYVSKYATSSKSTFSFSRFHKWFNKYSLQSKSTWTHAPARIVFVIISWTFNV